MGLNKVNPSGNMYQFVTHTWNVVKGKCYHNCKYCSLKKWGEQKDTFFDERELNSDLGSDRFIFVGSACDMFAKNIALSDIRKVLDHCKKYDNKYLFQSKNPIRIYTSKEYLPKNSIICTTLETNRVYPAIMGQCPSPDERSIAMKLLNKFEKHVTIEPIMDFDTDKFIEMIKYCNPTQVNIGADSCNTGLPEPSRDKLLDFIEKLGSFTKIENKRNLDRIIDVQKRDII